MNPRTVQGGQLCAGRLRAGPGCGNGQLDPNVFNAAVNRVTALRAGLF